MSQNINTSMISAKINEKISLKERELKKTPWSLEELQSFGGKAFRPSVIDSIEKYAWKTEGVSRVSRTRITDKYEFIDELRILFDDDKEVLIHSTEGTYILEFGNEYETK